MRGAKAVKANQIVIWGIVIWLVTVLGGVVHYHLHEPGPRYLSALENVIIFMIWQATALGVAVIVLVLRLVLAKQLSGTMRGLGLVPILLSGGFALLITLWVVLDV